MKKKFPFVIAYWWCMALFLLGLLPLALGNREGGVSESENRTLQALPRLSASAWWDGSFAEGLEAYLSDQMPGRDAILRGSARLLALFDAATDEERILDKNALKELGEMGSVLEEEPIEEDVSMPLPETPAPTQAFVGLVVEARAEATPEPAATPAPEGEEDPGTPTAPPFLVTEDEQP